LSFINYIFIICCIAALKLWYFFIKAKRLGSSGKCINGKRKSNNVASVKRVVTVVHIVTHMWDPDDDDLSHVESPSKVRRCSSRVRSHEKARDIYERLTACKFPLTLYSRQISLSVNEWMTAVKFSGTLDAEIAVTYIQSVFMNSRYCLSSADFFNNLKTASGTMFRIKQVIFFFI